MKLKLKQRKISLETEKNILPLKHDRYLSRVHTLMSTAISLIISLLLFLIAGLLEEILLLNRDTIFIFSLVAAIIITVSLTIYLNWKSIRIRCVDRLIDICETCETKLDRS